MKNRQLLHFFFCLLLAGFACSQSVSAPDNVLRIALGAEPPTLDWSLATDSESIGVIQNLMDGLTRFDPNLKPVPAIAHSWYFSANHQEIIYQLRKDVYWTDGRRVTAHDFEYSWKRLLTPTTASQYAYFLFDIANAHEYNSGKLDSSDKVGVKALSDFVLQVKLKRPIVYFPSITTFTATFPQRADLIEKHGEQWTDPENLITVGAFTLEKWKHEYKLVLKANPKHYAGSPEIDAVTAYIVEEPSTALALYQTGGLDVTDLPPVAMETYDDHPEHIHTTSLAGNYYSFNVHKKPFDNPLIRRAFAQAINRKRLPNILKGGQIPSASWIPRGMFGHNPDIGVKFNPGKASELLAEAGFPGGKGFPPVTAVYNTNPINRLVAEFLQGQWKKYLNVTVTLESMEWKVFLSKLKLDPPQLYRGAWNADFPDPDNFMNLFTFASGNNRSHWKNNEYDGLVAAAAMEPDLTRRQILYNRAQKILTEEETAIIPLFTSSTHRLVKPYVKNYTLNTMDLHYLKEIRLERRAK